MRVPPPCCKPPPSTPLYQVLMGLAPPPWLWSVFGDQDDHGGHIWSGFDDQKLSGEHRQDTYVSTSQILDLETKISE